MQKTAEIDNVIRKVETEGKKSKGKYLYYLKYLFKNKINPLMGSLVDWTQPKKETMSLKIQSPL